VVTRSDPSFQLPTGVEPATIPHGRLPEEGASFSGHERDKLFLNLGNGQFKDVSGVSGADDPGDGRVFALLDFDHDGWWDIAEINANAPALKLYQNRFGADPGWRATHNVIALRLVGGNREAKPTEGASNRDGIGALVTVDLGDTRLVREHRAGEGFAGQNSPTMLIGIGAHRSAEKITVRWPSGRTQTVDRVPAGRLVTVREEALDAPGRVEVAEYAIGGTPAWAKATPAGPSSTVTLDLPADAPRSPLRVFVTFATWCQACRGDVPQLARLREAFPDHRVGLFGVPIDPNDERAKVEEWITSNRPPYTMLLGLPPEQLAAVKQLLKDRLRRDALPSSVITNRDGTVLKVMEGVPTVSDLRVFADGTSRSR
jgi:thiol-disulfide isomerase/thioredoxin